MNFNLSDCIESWPVYVLLGVGGGIAIYLDHLNKCCLIICCECCTIVLKCCVNIKSWITLLIYSVDHTYYLVHIIICISTHTHVLHMATLYRYILVYTVIVSNFIIIWLSLCFVWHSQHWFHKDILDFAFNIIIDLWNQVSVQYS